MPNTQLLPGAAGPVEILIDAIANPRAVALVAHPHPMMGGHAQHTLPFTLACALNHAGASTWRPNFRGVGGSAGNYDHGNGETDDLLAVLGHLCHAHPGLPVLLVGFSFGAHVVCRVAARCAEHQLGYRDAILCGLPHGDVPAHRHYDSPRLPDALLIHGERDQNVPLQQPLAWAAEAGLAVNVVPGADHFFTGKLKVLARLVSDRVALRLVQPCHSVGYASI